MEEKSKEKSQDNLAQSTLSFPGIDENTRKKVCLVVNNDGFESTKNYLINLLERFRDYFGKVYIISEDEENADFLNNLNGISLVSSLKPYNLSGDWALILETGEFPSIQFIKNISEIIEKAKSSVNVIKFPIVICDNRNGEIIEIIEPKARFFRQNPYLLQKYSSEEIILADYPLIRIVNNSEAGNTI